MPVTVDDILESPFLKKNWEERMKIIVEGKPRPFLNMAAVVTVQSDNDGELKTQQFSPTIYDDVLWLTGCEKRNAFFCWPCLLLNKLGLWNTTGVKKLGIWNTTGVSNLKYLVEGMSKHEESVHHIEAMLQFQGMVEEFSAASRTDVKQYNDIVDRNRQIMKRLIDAVCYLFVKENASSERNKGCQLEQKNCVKTLQFLRSYDRLNCNYIEDAVDLVNITPNIIDDIVNAIAKTIKLAIRKEVQASTYVSIILSDHSKIPSKSQISTILRYIKDGNVVEKFVGFMNMSDQNTRDFVFRHIVYTAAEFGITERLLAISLDGGILPASELPQLILAIKGKFPNSFFVPWCCHDLDYVLKQSLTSIKECGIFFGEMNEMKDFFNKKSKQYESMKSYIESTSVSFKAKSLTKSRFITVMNCHRRHFIAFFERMILNSNEWEAEDVTKALGFKRILEDFQTKFLLLAFSKLFNIISPLSAILKGPKRETILGSEVHKQVLQQLSNEYEGGFEELWYEASKDESTSVPLAKRIKIDYDDPKILTYRDLYVSINGLLINDIDCRFSALHVLHFSHLLSCDPYGNFTFNNEMLQSLMAVHGTQFSEDQLRNEFIVLRTNGKVFGKKSVYELLDFFIQLKLKNGFKYLYKLCEFVLTLPINPPSEKNKSKKLKKINSWSYVPEVLTVQSGDVGIPCVELDYLQELRKSDSFYSELSEVFYEANKTFELIYK